MKNRGRAQGKSAHTSFFKAANVPQFVGRRQELLTGRRVVLQVPSAARIDREKKPLSLSDVKSLRCGSAHLWTHWSCWELVRWGKAKSLRQAAEQQSKLTGLDFIQPGEQLLSTAEETGFRRRSGLPRYTGSRRSMTPATVKENETNKQTI